MATTETLKVGFIALGDIGLPMVENLLKGNFEVLVFDLRENAVEKAVAMGATAATSVKEIAMRCDYICVAVVNEAQMQKIVAGPDGLFENAKRGTAILAHSTMPPEVAKQFAQRAEEKGLEWLDAPMSGANIAAKAGTLTFLIGGQAALLERCRPLLNAMGSNIFHLGPVGNGQVAKLVNGVMFHVGYVVTLEALKLAASYGVPEEQIIALASVSTGNSWIVQHWGFFDHLVREHQQGVEEVIREHLRKDIGDALIAAKTVKTPMPITALAMQLYPDLVFDRLAEQEADKSARM